MQSDAQHAPLHSQLKSIRNMRDLAGAGSNIRAGKLFRSACPLEANIDDCKVFLEDLGIGRLIDLRTDLEWAKNPEHAWLLANCQVYKAQRGPSGSFKMELQQDSSKGAVEPLVIQRISLQEWKPYTHAFVARLPILRQLPILFWFWLSKILGWEHPVPQVRKRVLSNINQEGLPGMYRTILTGFRAEVALVLQAVLEAAEQGVPTCIYCKLGKDRTGLISMLILSCCGASDDAIIADYTRSQGLYDLLASDPTVKGLTAGGLNATVFSCAPSSAMMDALSFLRTHHGSIAGYLASAGFDQYHQEQLAKALTS